MINKIKLSQVANIIAGQSPESKYYTTDSTQIPFLQGNRTFGDIYPYIDTYTTKVTKMAPSGSILMSVRAPVGDLNIATDDVCIGRGLVAINAKDGNNQALYYVLKHNIPAIVKKGNGTTYDSITIDILNDVEIAIPENVEKYSCILAQIDEQIQRNKDMVHKLRFNDTTTSCFSMKGEMRYAS